MPRLCQPLPSNNGLYARPCLLCKDCIHLDTYHLTYQQLYYNYKRTIGSAGIHIDFKVHFTHVVSSQWKVVPTYGSKAKAQQRFVRQTLPASPTTCTTKKCKSQQSCNALLILENRWQCDQLLRTDERIQIKFINWLQNEMKWWYSSISWWHYKFQYCQPKLCWHKHKELSHYVVVLKKLWTLKDFVVGEWLSCQNCKILAYRYYLSQHAQPVSGISL